VYRKQETKGKDTSRTDTITTLIKLPKLLAFSS